MAFAAALRRVSSVATSASLLVLRSRQIHHISAILGPLPLQPVFPRSTSPLVRFASSALKKPAFDSELVRVIDSEIKCAEESDDHCRVEEIPRGFPFDVQDVKGMNVITLKRTYQNESIEVVVSMPSLVTGEEPAEGGGEDEDGNEDGDYEKPGQSSIPLVVTMAKEGSPTLEFSCTAYPDEVAIDSLSVRGNTQTEEEGLAYEGPDFNDLDENLQKAFHKYLELRGISALTTNFLHEYMINKDSREYLLWLKKLKQFIQK